MTRINAYGMLLGLEREGARWAVFYLGGDGKRRRARDIEIPSTVPDLESALTFIADILHESASERNPGVRVIG